MSAIDRIFFTKLIPQDESTVNEYLREIFVEEAPKGYTAIMATSLVAVEKNGERKVFPIQETGQIRSPVCQTRADAEREVGKLYTESIDDGWKLDADSNTGLSEVWGSA